VLVEALVVEHELKLSRLAHEHLELVSAVSARSSWY